MKKIKFNDWLNEISVLIDSREKENTHIITTLNKFNIKYMIGKLDFCDYGYCYNIDKEFYIGNIVIERKNSLDELSQNFTKNRDRFKAEWERVPIGLKRHLIIEDNTINDMFTESYRSKINRNAFIASLLSFISKYDINVHFISKTYTCELMLRLFYYNFYYTESIKVASWYENVMKFIEA